jgi:hypothetical protein
MITFRNRLARVNYWRKFGNTCRKPGIDCCSAWVSLVTLAAVNF